jgi:hypothetical protein
MIDMIPTWVTIAGALGIGSFAGSAATVWFSARQQHKNWVNDQKRAEYRELLDTLYDSVTTITNLRPSVIPVSTPEFNQAVQKLARVFEDRIFIAGKLDESGARKDWRDMQVVIWYVPELQAQTAPGFLYTVTNLRTRENDLRKKIIALAQKDVVKFHW